MSQHEIKPPPLGTVSQVAYVVRDLDTALKYWIDVIHAGPLFCLPTRAPRKSALPWWPFRGGCDSGGG